MPSRRHHPLDQLLLEPGPRGRLAAGDRALAAAGQQVLDVAEGEPAVADGAPQLLERVAALAHPRDHPGLGRGGRGPAAAPRPGSPSPRAQRFSVDGETPEIREASLSEIGSSATGRSYDGPGEPHV